MAFVEFGFVVIAVGVFEKPFVPYYAGLEAWRRVWPDSMSHAKTFRDPAAYSGKVSKIIPDPLVDELSEPTDQLTLVRMSSSSATKLRASTSSTR